jgi:hypothetical protein
LAEF